MLAPTLMTMVPVVVLLTHMVWLGASGDDNAPELPREERKRHLMWGMFYMNPDDPRGWVDKTWGYGRTVNMRSPGHVYLFSAMIVTCLVGAVWMTVCATGA